jgi:hypothetical protein
MTQFTAASVYGATPQAPSFGVAAPTQQMGLDDLRTGWKGLMDPKNPLVWFGVVLALTVGFAGVAGSARIGPARVAASVGSA